MAPCPTPTRPSGRAAADSDELNNVYHDPKYREIREDLKLGLWHAQAAVGDSPHPSQPVSDGVALDAVRPPAPGTEHPHRDHVAAD